MKECLFLKNFKKTNISELFSDNFALFSLILETETKKCCRNKNMFIHQTILINIATFIPPFKPMKFIRNNLDALNQITYFYYHKNNQIVLKHVFYWSSCLTIKLSKHIETELAISYNSILLSIPKRE